LQSSLNNIDVSNYILNDVSMDVNDLLNDVPQMISNIEENGTQNQHNPKPCVVPNEDDNRTSQDVPNDDCTEPNVHNPASRHKGSKLITMSLELGSTLSIFEKNVGSIGKKKTNKSTNFDDILDHKFC
jgi:hypothetical protein